MADVESKGKDTNKETDNETAYCAHCQGKTDEKMLQCHEGKCWVHYKCTQLPIYMLYNLVKSQRRYSCKNCSPTVPENFITISENIFNTDNDKLQQELEHLKIENEKIKLELSNRNSNINTLQDQISNLLDEKQKVTSASKQLLVEKEDISEQNELHIENEQLKSIQKKCNTYTHNLEETLKKLQAEKNNANFNEEDTNGLVIEIDELKEVIKKEKGLNNEKNKEIKSLKTQMSNLEDTLKTKDIKIEEITNTLKRKESELSRQTDYINLIETNPGDVTFRTTNDVSNEVLTSSKQIIEDIITRKKSKSKRVYR